jgi:hypothetical protein
MEPHEKSPQQPYSPFEVLQQMLGYRLDPEAEYLPGEYHITVTDIDDYLKWAENYAFISIKKEKTREMKGWEAALIFPNGKTLTLWQERWQENTSTY